MARCCIGGREADSTLGGTHTHSRAVNSSTLAPAPTPLGAAASCSQQAREAPEAPACWRDRLLQAVWLFEAITAARHKYFLDPRREARGWRVTPVIAAEQQVRPPCNCWYQGSWLAAACTLVELLS